MLKKKRKKFIDSTMFPNSKREISKCFFPFSSKFLPSNPFNSREKSFRMRNEVNKWNKGTGSYRGCLLKRMALEFTCHLPRNMKQRVAGTRWKWDEAGVVERGWRRGRIKREREREHVVIHRRTYACPKWYYVTIYAPPPSLPSCTRVRDVWVNVHGAPLRVRNRRYKTA